MSDTRAADLHLRDRPVAATPRVTRSSSAPRPTRADRHGDGRIAVEAVELHAHVERDDVAVDQRRVADGMPCTTCFVHRRAERRGIPAVPLERRLRARRPHQRSRPARRDPPSSRPAPPAARAPPAPRRPAGSRRASARSPPATCRRSRRARSRPPTASPTPQSIDPPSPRPAAGPRRSTGTSAAPVELDERLRLPRGRPAAAPRTTRRCRRSRCTSAPPQLAARRIASSRPARSTPQRRRRSAARRQPPHQHVLRHHDVDHHQRTAPVDHLVERVGLRHRARKPVEHEPRQRVRPPSRSRDDADHHVVADQLPRVHRAPWPAFRARVPACTASRRMSPVEIFGSRVRARQPLRLRAFARARRAEHHDVQRQSRCTGCTTLQPRRPRIRVFFMNPS